MNASADHAGVWAVVVTYEPDAARLQRLVAATRPQVAAIVVVDNASQRPPAADVLAGCQLLTLPANRGLAAAQNAGIAQARAQGARWLLLLDQDSVPEATMVSELLDMSQRCTAAGLRLAATGPAVVDGEGGFEGFVRHRDGAYRALTAADGPGPGIDCDFLIASGSLIAMPVIDAVGLMDERLFIDKIDTEWALRARAAGYVMVGAPQARLHHSLGERRVSLWFGQWRRLSLHKPFRYYYMVRNSLLLRRLPHASADWRRADLRQLRSIVLYFGILAPGRGRALWMMLRGLVDGLRGVTGPLR